jgi:hypothetical protein
MNVLQWAFISIVVLLGNFFWCLVLDSHKEAIKTLRAGLGEIDRRKTKRRSIDKDVK